MPAWSAKIYSFPEREEQAPPGALQSWRGKAFTAEELQGFDLRKVLGIGCQLQIIHKEGNNGTTYANVETMLALPRGRSVPAPQEITWFDFDDPSSYGTFEKLPRYVQEKIAEAENFADTGLKLPDEKRRPTQEFHRPRRTPAGWIMRKYPTAILNRCFKG